jgi:hypothetical protein
VGGGGDGDGWQHPADQVTLPLSVSAANSIAAFLATIFPPSEEKKHKKESAKAEATYRQILREDRLFCIILGLLLPFGC